MSAKDHEVSGVEYVPVCERCWGPVELPDDNGPWRHAHDDEEPVRAVETPPSPMMDNPKSTVTVTESIHLETPPSPEGEADAE